MNSPKSVRNLVDRSRISSEPSADGPVLGRGPYARLRAVKGNANDPGQTLVMGSEELRIMSHLHLVTPSSPASVVVPQAGPAQDPVPAASTQSVPETPAAPAQDVAAPANEQSVPETPAEPTATDKPLAVSRLVVTVYRFAGFGILSIILLGLMSYLAVNTFYFVSTSWIVPTSLSPADAHVLQLDSIRSQESAARGALEMQVLQLGAQLTDARRIVESEQAFQEGFRQAMATDLGDRKTQLTKLASLLSSYSRSKSAIQSSNAAFVGMQRGQLASQYGAHVIDRDQMIQGNYQMAQIAGANLALDAKHVEIDTQAAELEREVQSLESAETAAANGSPVSAQFSYEILHMKHEYDLSILASKKAQDLALSLKMSLAMLEKTIAQHDGMLETINHSPYMMAADKAYTMAFVPYDNRDKLVVGAPVYSCRLGFVICSKVGAVAEVVDGEIVAKHPLRNKDLRGIMARLNLTEPKAIEQASLFIGGRPLGV
jgi:hypothetical protein